MFRKIKLLLLMFIGLGIVLYVASTNVKATDITHVSSVASYEVNESGLTPLLENGAVIENSNTFYGNTLNLEINTQPTGLVFSFYEEKGLFYSNKDNQEFRVTENHQFKAYFRNEEKAHVVILDANNKILGQFVCNQGTVLNEEELNEYKNSLNDVPGYNFSNWNYDFSVPVNNLTIIKAVYEANDVYFEVNINNGGLDKQSVLYGKTITVEAPATKDAQFFSHWTINGVIASYKRVYTFSVYENSDVVAVYKDTLETKDTFAYLSKNVIANENKKIFIAQTQSNGDVVERGIIFLETEEQVADFDFGTDGVVRVRAVRVSRNNEFSVIRTHDNSKNLYVKSYIVVKNGEVFETTYSEMLEIEKEITHTYATDLFFSEYIEGSGSNKALEIFNGTGRDIELSSYSIKLYTNGASTPTYTLVLEGIIYHGETYVIGHKDSVAELKSKINIENASVVNFNGDDAVALLKNNIVIDSIGQVGFDPGTEWKSNGVSTLNMTLVRKPNISTGRTNSTEAFDPSIEWIAYESDTFDYLGTHVMDNVAPIEGLDEYKQTAKEELENYANLGDYSIAVSHLVLNEIDNGKNQIDSASSFSVIDNILSSTKHNVDLLPTKLVEYNEAKVNLVLPNDDIYGDINPGSSLKKYITYSWRFDPEGIFDSETGAFHAPEVDTIVNIEVDILIDGVKFGETLATIVTAKAPLNNEELYNNGVLYVDNIMASFGTDIDFDLELPTSHPDFANLTFVWSSSHPEIIANEGKYTAPEVDTEVILTVSILIEGKECGADLTYNIIAKKKSITYEQIAKFDLESNTDSKNSYALDNVNINGYSWALNNALIGNLDNDKKNGSYSIRTQNIGAYIMMNFDFENVSYVTLLAARYGTDKSGGFIFEKSIDGGNSWVKIGDSQTVSSTTLTEFSFELNETGNVRIKITLVEPTPSKGRINFDDICFYRESA